MLESLSIIMRTGRITLRPISKKDEPFLQSLFAGSRPDLDWITGINPEMKNALLHQQYICEQEHIKREYPEAELGIVLLEGRSIGQLFVNAGLDSMHILSIILLPEYRGRGIGRHIMEELQRWAHNAGKTVSLQVFWYNSAARALYDKLGFKITENAGVYFKMQWTP